MKGKKALEPESCIQMPVQPITQELHDSGEVPFICEME